MTYNLNIDQQFAIEHGLTLTQVSTLAAFMTLPIWSNTMAIDGVVWYQYSEEKMAEDFPLLFGIPKRCYKNISELCGMGFVELTKVGRTKYMRFTDLCADWNKEKVQKRTESPKTDQEKSENGLNMGEKSPKTDRTHINYNIKDNYIINDKRNGACAPPPPREYKREKKCLFANSKYYDFEKFCERLENEPDVAGLNIDYFYYYNRAKNWSGANGKMKNDWILAVKNWMMDDVQKGKLVTKKTDGLDPDMIKYLELCAR